VAKQRSLLTLSLLFHGAIGVAVAGIDSREARVATSIEIAETKKKLEAKKAVEPPKPPPEPPKRLAKQAPAPQKQVEAAPPAPAPLEALPDFGLELSGGVGGLAVAATDLGKAPVAAKTALATKAPAAVVKRPVARAAADDPCEEPAAKPRPLNVPQPTYSERAREAGIEGKVRVELTVDETGRVVSVRVLQGLGYGLDEAAVAAAERATFEPAVRCGKPSRATFTMGIRFSST
jgi:periplasmic protein TonB